MFRGPYFILLHQVIKKEEPLQGVKSSKDTTICTAALISGEGRSEGQGEHILLSEPKQVFLDCISRLQTSKSAKMI